MKKTVLFLLAGLTLCSTACNKADRRRAERTEIRTVCNPIDLSYRFRPEAPSRREAADPSVVLFGNEYYLFVSKSGGYFHSSDLVHWNLIVPEGFFPLENYAPTAVVIDGSVYFVTSGCDKVLKSDDPKSGKWEIVKEGFVPTDTDPALFLDDDGKLYYFGGCSNENPIFGVEIDPLTWTMLGEKVPLINSCTEKYGWEVQGDYNTLVDRKPWIEGAWVNKFKGKYYLQYAGPGTEFKSYNDGMYVAEHPLGPYIPAQTNPYSYRPGGFAVGAGHGSTFADKHGNLWHAGTVNVSMRYSFERRLLLSPVFIDEDGEMYAHTGFGDYPMIVPDGKIASPSEIFPELMLLSYNKPVAVSSSLKIDAETAEKMKEWWIAAENFEGKNAVDEEIRTWWSAETGEADEWFSVDLENVCEVYALQINFADQDAELFGREDGIYYRYLVEESRDGKDWNVIVDKSENTTDAPHEYLQFDIPVRTRYLKIRNLRVPSGKFSLYDFRVFGKGDKKSPAEVSEFVAARGADRRTVRLSWNKSPDAVGYNVRFGCDENKLYQNYQVYGNTELDINVLNTEQSYFFAIDAFNEGGTTRGKTVRKTP